MTTLDFKNALTENAFSYGNDFNYSDSIKPFGLYFTPGSINYPFILKGGESDEFELEYSTYTYQLRSRVLNTKKIKEVMDSSRLPLLFNIKRRNYLIGKGFLSEYEYTADVNKILFIACVDDSRSVSSISQVKFFVSKEVYEEKHKALQPAIKDFIGTHIGDVTICNDILDYVSEKIIFPRGVTLAELNRHKDAVVRAAVIDAFNLGHDAPLVVDATNFQGLVESVQIYADPDTNLDRDHLPW